ncbi:glycoside hydrolase superfamily [Crepidotus variabilis]|uniref:chitinase n=1 Tax=Crepidotus variabilis TaxID=179855 RepID=A0A9P6EUC4_9AGAR|nr:glycoside hydrolase superfamily [Crepidotus variabilis]
MLFSILALFAASIMPALGFSSQRTDNLAVYWGQDGAGQQQSLGFYCDDDTIDVIPLAFLYTFFGQGGMPILDFSNICSNGGKAFSGTGLADCSYMAADIQKCQAKGKLITLSLGGATANVGFGNSGDAASFANTIWNLFLGGNGPMRPFGNAILDGVDLDIENGSSMFYDTFVNTLRSLMQSSAKKFYITAAPQCPFPDAKVGQALSSSYFDAVYVQFYNNYCETSSPSDFNFATWDNWAKTQSLNKNVKVYLGAPGSPAAAGSGYVPPQNLIDMARDAQQKYSSFGGIMLWDADTAYNNNRFHVTVKNGIRNGGSAPPDTPLPSSSYTGYPNPTQTYPGSPTPTSTRTGRPRSTKPSAAPTISSSIVKVVSPTTPRPDPRASGRVRRPSSWTDNPDAENNDELTKPMRRDSRFFRRK